MPRRVSLPGVEALFSQGKERARGQAEGLGEEGPDTHTSMPAEAEEKPQKFTFYFEPETLEALDEAWFRMRKRLGSRISKSAIVDRIVKDAVKDLNRLEKLLIASP